MRWRRDWVWAGLTVLPSIVLLAIFVYWFIGQTVWASLTDWGQSAAMALEPEIHGVGLRNFGELFGGFLQFRFRQDIVNMIGFTLLFVSASLAAGLLLATLVDQRIRCEAVFRTIFLYPMSLSFIVTGTVWRWLLQPGGGINLIPRAAGLPPWGALWLSSRNQVLAFDWQRMPEYLSWLALFGVGAGAVFCLIRRRFRAAGMLGIGFAVAAIWVLSGQAARFTALPMTESHGFSLALIGIVLAAVWQMSGYTMALFLAGLRTVPDELREAARVDGATRLQVYWYVELPFLAPITWSAIIVLGHIALKIFDLVFAMTGPDHVPTSMPAMSMYLNTFRGNQIAIGAAIAVILLLMVSVLIIPYLLTSMGKGGRR